MALFMLDDLNEYGSPRGTIAHANHQCDSTPCFGLLRGLITGNITPTDIDGVTEVSGLYLNFEYKQSGKKVGTGQMRMIKDKVRKGETYLIIWHDGLTRDNKITKIQVLHKYKSINHEFETYQEGQNYFKAFYAMWGKCAREGNPF